MMLLWHAPCSVCVCVLAINTCPLYLPVCRVDTRYLPSPAAAPRTVLLPSAGAGDPGLDNTTTSTTQAQVQISRYRHLD